MSERLTAEKIVEIITVAGREMRCSISPLPPDLTIDTTGSMSQSEQPQAQAQMPHPLPVPSTAVNTGLLPSLMSLQIELPKKLAASQKQHPLRSQGNRRARDARQRIKEN